MFLHLFFLHYVDALEMVDDELKKLEHIFQVVIMNPMSFFDSTVLDQTKPTSALFLFWNDHPQHHPSTIPSSTPLAVFCTQPRFREEILADRSRRFFGKTTGKKNDTLQETNISPPKNAILKMIFRTPQGGIC